MDPIAQIKVYKDTTLALLLEAGRRGWSIHYMEPEDLFTRDGTPCARMCEMTVRDDPQRWFERGDACERPLSDMDVILMRKDPPFNMEYIYATYTLELAEAQGVLVVNRPAGLRNVSEKMAIMRFPECCAPTLVGRDVTRIRKFLQEHEDIVVKPLDGMGGASVFRLRQGDTNTSVILETVTDFGRRSTMAQRYLPGIAQGDKRILMIEGEPVPYALARIAAEGEGRANLAAGGHGEGRELSDRDRWICAQVSPLLKQQGILFAGLDVIGDYLTEINVTSPTCVRELDRIYGINIAGMLMDAIEGRLQQH
jgi:glutathione synthase